ncbi:hypothetical protein PINS_up019688 [Pythium insidiosum]|nr:hypothetical protein PINS_up019688 [Pythium insidiosum]
MVVEHTPLGRRTRVVCAVLVLTLHGAYLGTYCFEARQYVNQIRVNADLQNAYTRAIGMVYEASKGRSYAMVLTSSFIAAWHTVSVIRALNATIRHRALLLSFPVKQSTSPQPDVMVSIKSKLARRATSGRSNTKLARMMKAVRVAIRPIILVFSRLRTLWRVYFTMDGEHYETGTELRETLEVITQIRVVQRMTGIISEFALVNLAVVVLVLNCWSTPMLRQLLCHSTITTNRMTRLVFSMVLATCFTIGITEFAWRRVNRISREGNLFWDIPTSTYFRFTSQLTLIQNWSDVFSTRLAACMAIVALEAAKRKIALLPSGSQPTSAARKILGVQDISKMAEKTEKTATTKEKVGTISAAGERPSSKCAQPVCSCQQQRSFRSRVFDGLSVFAGFVVVAMHVESYVRHSPTSSIDGLKCDVFVRPWRTRRWPCAVLEINCHRAHIQGSGDELTALLDKVDVPSLSALRLTHCPQLEMPSRIQSLNYLAHLEVFNATISRWEADAALERTHHPYLGRLWLVRVSNISSLPPGLLQRNAPFVDIQICTTDLAALPEDLHERWPRSLTRLSLDANPITTLPVQSLKMMSSAEFSIQTTQITSIRPETLAGRFFVKLQFAGNPSLGNLPDVSWYSSLVDLRGTNTSVVPGWVTRPPTGSFNYRVGARSVGDSAGTTVLAFNTPLCTAILRANPKALVVPFPSGRVVCAPDATPRSKCSLPLTTIQAMRPL